MNLALQLTGVIAILIGFSGTWLAANHPIGWLFGLTSAGLWILPLTTGHQGAGLANCLISMGICLRNYLHADKPSHRLGPGPVKGRPTPHSGPARVPDAFPDPGPVESQ